MDLLPFQSFEEPEDGFGLQQAVLEEVGAGRRDATMLVWSSTPYVAVTRLESRRPGFPAAVAAMEGLGVPVLVRNSGGGAVAANEGSLSFSLTVPVEDLRHGLYERYAEGVDLVAGALRRVGVEAEGGEVEGEYCPGAYSVRSGGERGVKHAGLAQRVTKRAARMEALVLAEETAALLPALRAVYEALDSPLRPGSVGDLPASRDEVIGALTEEVRVRYETCEIPLSPATLRRAREMRGEWLAG